MEWVLLRSIEALIKEKEKWRNINKPLKIKYESQGGVPGRGKKKKKKQKFSSLNLGGAEKATLRKLSY